MRAPRDQGAALGVVASASGLARAVGPLAAGALFDWAIPAPYLLGAGLFAVCLIISRTVGVDMPAAATASGSGPSDGLRGSTTIR